ncbi:MAG: hypothetical protein J6Q11_02925 [Fibrobacteraceae bacterium]|nr:hypothetical protein [Fibrobacteraceae bacterium]
MSSSQFITNKDKILSEIIKSILPKCDNAYFLVGYFYFSGFKELCSELEKTNLKILVGLEVERSITNGIKEIDNLHFREKSRAQIRDEYYQEFVDIFNNTDLFDGKEQLEAFKLFCNKIMNGTLEIRKTLEPNHAKMYLFENRPSETCVGTFPGTLITGSSNLSITGLKDRLELNAILRGQNDYEEGRTIFDELWNDSVAIADAEHVPDFTENVIKHIWYEKLYKPYLMYLRVLSEYFSVASEGNLITPSDITGGVFSNLQYQLDAVKMALKAIENHSGVIIADVVGLGKSIVGSTVAKNLGLRTIIVCPPHLKQQWEEYKDEFKFTASVFSSGKISDALNHYNRITHPNEKFLIIVDEAHKYKNEFTQDYSILHDLCMGNKVILLTATPFNNRPEDIFSMLKLFQIPNKSTLKTVDNLGVAFKELIASYRELTESQRRNTRSSSEIKVEADLIAKRIRSIIGPLVVRRSRLDLEEIKAYREDLKEQNIQLVIPEDPISLNYDLRDTADLYLRTLNKISPDFGNFPKSEDFVCYKSARYKPSAYFTNDIKLKEQLARELEEKTGVEFNMLVGRQANISDFMRKLLVRRFESSVASFQSSLNAMIESSERILAWIEKRNKVPIYKKGTLPDVEEFYENTNDDISEEIAGAFDKYENKGFFEIDMKYICKEEYLADMQSDLNLLRKIREEWFGEKNQILVDHKLDEFKKLLKEQREKDPRRKIIVFTEFADTANYLGESLKNEDLGVFKYTSKESSSLSRKVIRENFDASEKANNQKNDYQILIATDAISEGYNLHRAGTIFNYDIPYNPTRVIQRIGRINRINKKVFDKLYIYNYFPTDIGEQETRTKQISTLKMAMIHAIMGEDTKVLTSDEQVNAYFKERYRKEINASEELSWDTKYREFLNQVKNTKEMEEALAIPHRSRIGRNLNNEKKGIILFGKKGNDFVFKFGHGENNEITSISAEDAFSLFEAIPEESPVKLSENFDSLYQLVKGKLFKDFEGKPEEKNKLEAFDKLKKWEEYRVLSKDYLSDLRKLLQSGNLTGEEIRFINKQKRENAYLVEKKITIDYIKRSMMKMSAVEEGEETLIIAEELQ